MRGVQPNWPFERTCSGTRCVCRSGFRCSLLLRESDSDRSRRYRFRLLRVAVVLRCSLFQIRPQWLQGHCQLTASLTYIATTLFTASLISAYIVVVHKIPKLGKGLHGLQQPVSLYLHISDSTHKNYNMKLIRCLNPLLYE